MNSLNAFIITSLAGLSTLLGLLIIFLFKTTNSFLYKSLAFSSGIMFSLSLFDLIPESIKYLNEETKIFFNIIIVIISILIGLSITFILDKFITFKTKDKTMYKIGILTMISLITHNILEGIATFITAEKSINLGITLAIAISMHNIPEGISTTLPIYYSSKSKKKVFFYVFITSLSEPIGAIISFLFLKPTYLTIGIIYSIISGIMIYISMFEIIPNITTNKNYKIIIIFYSLGIIFIILNKILF